MPIPWRDTEALERLRNELCKRPLTIHEVRARYQISEATAYRWLRALQADGDDVVRRRRGFKVFLSIAKKGT